MIFLKKYSKGNTLQLDPSHKPKLPEELEHSRPLDVHKWSDFKHVNGFIDLIWDEFFSSSYPVSAKAGNRSKSSPKKQLKVLLLDLYVAWLSDPTLLVGIGLSKSAYKAKSRYNELHISFELVTIVHLAVGVGLIDYHYGTEGSGMVTRIWPTAYLIDKFIEADLGIEDIYHHLDVEVICLGRNNFEAEVDASKKHKYVEYEDKDAPEAIHQWRIDLKAYNKLLEESCIDIVTLEVPVVKHPYWDKTLKRHLHQTVEISPRNSFIKRVFYREDWSLGGRFHGGWWQMVGSKWRKHIHINDKPTDEQDFSGLHVTLLYGLEGLQPPPDPYALNLESNFTKEENRAIIKGLVLTAINAKSRKTAFKAFREGQKTDSAQKGLKDTELTIILDAFCSNNQPIADYLCKDMGVQLMAMDGRITSKVINHFTNKGVPVLTVHDSYLVDIEYQKELNEVMNEAITAELGFASTKFKVRIKPTYRAMGSIKAWEREEGTSPDLVKMYADTPNSKRCSGYLERLALHFPLI
jgi:hypothetical protein